MLRLPTVLPDDGGARNRLNVIVNCNDASDGSISCATSDAVRFVRAGSDAIQSVSAYEENWTCCIASDSSESVMRFDWRYWTTVVDDTCDSDRIDEIDSNGTVPVVVVTASVIEALCTEFTTVAGFADDHRKSGEKMTSIIRTKTSNPERSFSSSGLEAPRLCCRRVINSQFVKNSVDLISSNLNHSHRSSAVPEQSQSRITRNSKTNGNARYTWYSAALNGETTEIIRSAAVNSTAVQYRLI